MEIAIVDDEDAARKELAALLRTYLAERSGPPVHVHLFASGEELMASPLSFDLVFLDIQMPGTDGMVTAQELRQRRFAGDIVFTTVLSEYVFDAFGVEAADFLVKPIATERLAGTLDRLLAKRQSSRQIIIRQRTGTTVVRLSEIESCEVRGRRLYLQLRDGREIIFYGKMDSFAAELDGRFFRCHRSYLINLDCVSAIGAGQIQLCSRRKVPLSRLRETAFRQALLAHLKERRPSDEHDVD